jgi:hypothetical protein
VAALRAITRHNATTVRSELRFAGSGSDDLNDASEKPHPDLARIIDVPATVNQTTPGHQIYALNKCAVRMVLISLAAIRRRFIADLPGNVHRQGRWQPCTDSFRSPYGQGIRVHDMYPLRAQMYPNAMGGAKTYRLIDDASGRHQPAPRTRWYIGGVDELPGNSVLVTVEFGEPETAVQCRRDVGSGAAVPVIRRAASLAAQDVVGIVVLARPGVLDLPVAGMAARPGEA